MSGTNGRPEDAVAPTYPVPPERVVSIEHPCIVKTFDNGVKSFGGEPQLKHILEHHVGDSTAYPDKQLEEPVIGVSLRPRDPLAKKLVSSAIETRNVLVKVSLPKRTGRKRKRASDQPFTHHPNDTNIGNIDDNTSSSNSTIAAPDFLRRLKDNSTNYTIQPIGTINETHRFRNLPDFQMIASENAMMRELAVHARPNYEALKTLAIDMRPGASHIESFVAPPSFMAANMPYRYEFNQASGVKFGQDESGNAITTNIQAPPRRVVVAVEPDVEQVPQAPPASLERHHQFGHYLDDAIRALGELLEKRPLLTRRVAMNFIPQYSDSVFKEATQWVGYSFRAGPWRDSLIKYGVDPRKDPKYRIYQTLMFQLDKRSDAAAAPPAGNPDDSIPTTTNPPSTWQNHIFDGHHIRPGGGKTWQICDVTDPLLKSLFQTPSIQTECDVHQFGWYYNGTLCKARAIMRDKMDHLFRGATPPEAEYEKIARMPDRITRDKLAETYLEDAEAGSRSNVLAIDVRSMARLGEKNREIRARERRVRAAMERAAERGVEYDDDEEGEEGEKAEDGEDEEMGAIDPALLDAGESMRGDLEADDEEDDEDADADLEAAGYLQDDDEAEGDEKHQQDGEE